MVVEMTVERDNTGAALQEVFKGFDSLNARPVSQEELIRTITAYRTAIAATAETGRGFAGYVIDSATLGIALEDDHARRERIAALTLDPVRAEAPALASLDASLIVVAGDADVILPQLAAIGIKDVEIFRRDKIEEPQTRDAGVTEEPRPALPSVADGPAGAGSTRLPGGCDPTTGRNCVPETDPAR